MTLQAELEKQLANNQVTEYSETQARLAEIKETYGTEVPDASTKEGYTRCKEVSQEMVSLRTGIEKKRKDLKAPILAMGKLVDSQAKDITAQIQSIETPFKEAYRAVDEEKKRIKAEIEERFVYLKTLVSNSRELSSDEIEKLIEQIAEYDVSKATFGRRVDEASAVVASTLDGLSSLLSTVIEEEAQRRKDEEDRAELERLRAEKQKRDEEEARRIAEEKRKEREEQIRKEAAERAEREAEEAKRRAEESEKLRIEAEKRAEEQRKIDAENAKIAAEQAAERARLAEQQRQKEEEERKQREQEERAARIEHSRAINNEAMDCLIAFGLEPAQAKMAIEAIAKKQVKHVTIKY